METGHDTITQPVLSGTAASLWLRYFWSLHAVMEGPPMDTGMQPAAEGDSVALAGCSVGFSSQPWLC